MAIKKRTKIDSKAFATREEGPTDGGSQAKHPLLRGIAGDVYAFVKNNPRCTRDDISRGLSMKSSTATARVKELIDEGYIIEPYGERKLNRSGVRAKVLVATDRAKGGTPLSRILVAIELTIDCNGVYGVRASIVGGEQQRAGATVIATKKLTIVAPHPDSYSTPSEEGTVQRIGPTEIMQYAADTILDGDFEVTN